MAPSALIHAGIKFVGRLPHALTEIAPLALNRGHVTSRDITGHFL